MSLKKIFWALLAGVSISVGGCEDGGSPPADATEEGAADSDAADEISTDPDAADSADDFIQLDIRPDPLYGDPSMF